MNRYIKIQYLKSGIPTGGFYTYKTTLDVQLGEIVMLSEKVKGIVVGFTTIDMIPDPTRVNAIFGQIPKEVADNA